MFSKLISATGQCLRSTRNRARWAMLLGDWVYCCEAAHCAFCDNMHVHQPCVQGNFEAVEHLLTMDRDKQMVKVVYGSRAPLHQAAAAKEGRLNTCKLLIDFDGEQLQIKTNDGSLPVHMLAQVTTCLCTTPMHTRVCGCLCSCVCWCIGAI